MSTPLGHLHFWPSLIAMNGVFMPMFIQGMAGFHRRWYDGGANYEQVTSRVLFNEGSFFSNMFNSGEAILMIDLNHVMTFFVWMLAIAQLPFIFNFFWSMFKGKRADSDNPWRATTMEWSAPNRPGHGNFTQEPVAYRGPYEYSVPGHDKDYTPQGEEGDDGTVIGELKPGGEFAPPSGH